MRLLNEEIVERPELSVDLRQLDYHITRNDGEAIGDIMGSLFKKYVSNGYNTNRLNKINEKLQKEYKY